MFGLERKKDSVCLVLQDSVCSVRSVRRFGMLGLAGMFVVGMFDE